jgi:hypothetical protein
MELATIAPSNQVYSSLRNLGLSLLKNQFLVKVSDRVLIYCGDVCGWEWIESTNAMNHLCILLHLHPSANCEVSTRHARRYLKDLDIVECSFDVSTTVCYKRRYEIVDMDDFYELVKCNPFETADDDESYDNSVSILGMKCPHFPRRIPKVQISNSALGTIDVWMRRTFGDSLLTIKWLLGNCMLDPKSDDFVVIITGPSMSGKTTAMNIINALFSCRTAVLDASLLVGKRLLNYNDVTACESARVTMTGRLEFHPSVGINTRNLIEITGGGPITGPNGERVTISQTLFATANYLPMLMSNREWCRPEHTRRFITIETLDRLSTADSRDERSRVPDFSNEEKGQFIAECISTRLLQKNVPLSLENILAALFLGNYTEISQYFGISTSPDDSESLQASRYLAQFTKMKYDILIRCVEVLSPSSIGEINGEKYIKELGMIVYPANVRFSARDYGERYNVTWKNVASFNTEEHSRSASSSGSGSGASRVRNENSKKIYSEGILGHEKWDRLEAVRTTD